ncbi:MAG TPA: hypothetical protein PKB10_04490, partial [Tepidisphaeraceae bacterium]|nr:hypothetical protein [Tepidisphaeraceae bacterium]
DGEADELAVMRRFGLQYDRMDLEAVFDVARKVPQRDLDRLRTALFEDARCRTVDVPVEQADQTLRLGLAIQRLAAERGYIGVTIKSWPELFDCYGCAADGAVSMLNDAGLCTAEEGEMPGLLSSLVMHALSAGSAVPTMMDVSVLDEPANEIGLWHCGACPTRWLARGAWYQATRHSILENADRESAVGMMLEFPLTGGPGTVVRYQSPDCGLCFAFEATLRPVDPMPMRGNYVAARPMHRTAGAILSTIMSRGLDHHWSLGFGHLGADVSLFNHFLEVEDIEVVPAGVSPQKSVGE